MIGPRLRAADSRQLRPLPCLRRGGLKSPRLHDRDELDVCGVELAAQETVDVERPRRVEAMHAGERVKAHTELSQQLGRCHHLVEGRRATLVDAKSIVQLARPVDAQTDQKPMLLEEHGPLFVEQHAIGLQIIFDALSGFCVSLLQRDDAAEEIQTPQRRLAALPGKHHFGACHTVDILPDEKLKRLVAHLACTWAVGQHLLAQIETVFAIEIAGRARRLGHDMKCPTRRRAHQRGNGVTVNHRAVPARLAKELAVPPQKSDSIDIDQSRTLRVRLLG